MLVGSVHINLVELWELDIEVGRAELVNLLNRTRSLFAKLIAREVQNFEAVLCLIELFLWLLATGAAPCHPDLRTAPFR